MIIHKSSKTAYSDSRSRIQAFNTSYKKFKSLRVTRSIDTVCGEFKLVISRPPKSESPFKVGDVIDILLEGSQVMRGKIYEVFLEGDSGSDQMIFMGRDITGDLVDSTVPDDSKVYTSGVNIFDIATKIIRSLGLSKTIGVVNLSGGVIEPFTSEEIVSCKTGDTVIEFLHKYCRKRQLFLNTDTNGNLVFFKAEGFRTANKLTNKFANNNNNVIFYRTKYNISNRFYRYICKTQEADLWDSGVVDADGTAIDGLVANTRQLEFKLEERARSSECKERAAEEANVRRARSFEYVVEVQGFRDSTTWGVNQFVLVDDDRANVSGEFLVKTVDYTVDNNRGSITRLTIASRDAYTTEAAVSKRTSQLSEAGSDWVNRAKDGVTKIAGQLSDTIRSVIGEDDD